MAGRTEKNPLKDLAFNVEATRDSKSSETETSNIPIHVRVKVQNKNDPSISNHYMLSLPDNEKRIMARTTSDQTIISFKLLMQPETDKIAIRKHRKSFINRLLPGVCFGIPKNEDEGPYLPGSSSTDNAGSVATFRGVEKRVNKNKYKPGGCLDPPFGEDKYAYAPPGKNELECQGNDTTILNKGDIVSQPEARTGGQISSKSSDIITYPLPMTDQTTKSKKSTRKGSSQYSESSELYFKPSKVKDTDKIESCDNSPNAFISDVEETENFSSEVDKTGIGERKKIESDSLTSQSSSTDILRFQKPCHDSENVNDKDASSKVTPTDKSGGTFVSPEAKTGIVTTTKSSHDANMEKEDMTKSKIPEPKKPTKEDYGNQPQSSQIEDKNLQDGTTCPDIGFVIPPITKHTKFDDNENKADDSKYKTNKSKSEPSLINEQTTTKPVQDEQLSNHIKLDDGPDDIDTGSKECFTTTKPVKQANDEVTDSSTDRTPVCVDISKSANPKHIDTSNVDRRTNQQSSLTEVQNTEQEINDKMPIGDRASAAKVPHLPVVDENNANKTAEEQETELDNTTAKNAQGDDDLIQSKTYKEPEDVKNIQNLQKDTICPDNNNFFDTQDINEQQKPSESDKVEIQHVHDLDISQSTEENAEEKAKSPKVKISKIEPEDTGSQNMNADDIKSLQHSQSLDPNKDKKDKLQNDEISRIFADDAGSQKKNIDSDDTKNVQPAQHQFFDPNKDLRPELQNDQVAESLPQDTGSRSGNTGNYDDVQHLQQDQQLHISDPNIDQKSKLQKNKISEYLPSENGSEKIDDDGVQNLQKAQQHHISESNKDLKPGLQKDEIFEPLPGDTGSSNLGYDDIQDLRQAQHHLSDPDKDLKPELTKDKILESLTGDTGSPNLINNDNQNLQKQDQTVDADKDLIFELQKSGSHETQITQDSQIGVNDRDSNETLQTKYQIKDIDPEKKYTDETHEESQDLVTIVGQQNDDKSSDLDKDIDNERKGIIPHGSDIESIKNLQKQRTSQMDETLGLRTKIQDEKDNMKKRTSSLDIENVSSLQRSKQSLDTKTSLTEDVMKDKEKKKTEHIQEPIEYEKRSKGDSIDENQSYTRTVRLGSSSENSPQLYQVYTKKLDAPVKVDLAFKSYVDKNKDLIIKTIDSRTLDQEPQKSMKVTKKHFSNLSDVIEVPPNSANKLRLQLQTSNKIPIKIQQNKSSPSISPKLSKKHKSSRLNSLEAIMSEEYVTRNSSSVINKCLGDIYEQSLVPLQQTMGNLKQELEYLTQQQRLLTEKLCAREKLGMGKKITKLKTCGCCHR